MTTIVENDLPLDFYHEAVERGTVSADIETSGLEFRQERIAGIAFKVPRGSSVFVRTHRLAAGEAPLVVNELLRHQGVIKLFHHALFDLRFMRYHWKTQAHDVRCTKVMAKLLDPRHQETTHSLKQMLPYYCGVQIAKGYATSDWFVDELSPEQITYVGEDVEYLAQLHNELYHRLLQAGKWEIARECFAFLPTRVELELHGYDPFTY